MADDHCNMHLGPALTDKPGHVCACVSLQAYCCYRLGRFEEVRWDSSDRGQCFLGGEAGRGKLG